MKIYDYKGRKNISGNRIREARLKKRLSQADFAAKLQIAGITMERDSVSRIEIGTRFVADYELMSPLSVEYYIIPVLYCQGGNKKIKDPGGSKVRQWSVVLFAVFGQ